jgi:hypothetical protein
MNTVLDSLTDYGPPVVLFVPEGKDTILIGCDFGLRHMVPVTLRVAMHGGEQGPVQEMHPSWETPSKFQLPPGTQWVSIARIDKGNVPVTVTWL